MLELSLKNLGRIAWTAYLQTMSNHQPFKNNLRNLVFINLVAFVMIWLSAWLQMFFFEKALDSREWRQLAYLWVIGVWIDILQILAFISSNRKGNRASIVLGVGWSFYFISSIAYGKPTFIRLDINDKLLLSFIKAIEFSILVFFDFTVMFIVTHFGKNCDQKHDNG